ncbi:vWA domain-containing protein [Criblamydia sequanensis]|uniref:Membrane protein n=1 Tax=Candidatus Criblamydia sequanensis CRIB-18 TaxID=1437425 RepID=A0A090D2F6_9BACT|nr:VWA domain-containing protein [Criblamydia sequanensis]CDR34615.1 putative membrane protein [Criblamydia sequanensis CRIB-18]
MIFGAKENIFLFLILPFFIYFVFREYRKNEKILAALGDLKILKKSSLLPYRYSYLIRFFFLLQSFSFLVLALMDPKGNPHYPAGVEKAFEQAKGGDVEMKSQEVVFLLDQSASMNVVDGRQKKSRLENAKTVIDDVVRQLNGEQISLYVFSNNLERKIASTIDYFYFRLHLREVGKKEFERGGTSLIKTMSQLVKEMSQKNRTLPATILLFSDGEETEASANPSIWKTLAQSSKNALPFRVFAVGMGTESGGVVPDVEYQGKKVTSKLEPKVLEEIARAFKGRYFASENYSSAALAAALIKEIRSKESFKVKKEAVDNKPLPVVYDLYFQYPLSLSIFFLILYLFTPPIPKLKKSFLILLLMSASQLQAVNEGTIKAKNYAEANMPEKASASLEAEIQREKEPWKKAILRYNQGASYMYSKEKRPARKYFLEEPLSKETFPPLTLRVKINEALIALENLMLLQEKAGSRGEFREADFYAAEGLYKHILESLKDARTLDCETQKLKGAKNCLPTKYLQEIENKARELHLIIRDQSYMAAFEKMPLTDVSLRLLGIIKRMKLRLSHLEKTIPNQEKNQLLTSEKEFAEGLLPFWDLYSKRLSTLRGEANQRVEGLKAKDSFNQFIQALSGSDLKTSLSYLSKTEQTLQNTLKSSFGESRALEALNVLIDSYESLEEEGFLRIGSLQALLDLQEESLLSLKERELIGFEFLETSTKLLRLSILNQSEENYRESEFFFQGAQFFLQLFMYKNTELKNSPKEILVKLLKMVWSFREMYRNYDMIDKKEEPNQLLWSVYFSLQAIEDDFDEAVLLIQTLGFNEDYSGKDRCQSVPWDDVNPLFDQGRLFLTEASSRMKPILKKLEDLLYIDQAIFSFKDALEAIDHPKGGNGCKGSPQKKKEEEEPEESEAPKPSDQQEEDVLKNLMEMEQEDAGFREEKAEPPKGVEKPW